MGTRLKELRMERNLRLKDVAEAVGVTLNAISMYESNVREPNIDIIKKLCKFFNVTSDYLIGLSDY